MNSAESRLQLTRQLTRSAELLAYARRKFPALTGIDLASERVDVTGIDAFFMFARRKPIATQLKFIFPGDWRGNGQQRSPYVWLPSPAAPGNWATRWPVSEYTVIYDAAARDGYIIPSKLFYEVYALNCAKWFYKYGPENPYAQVMHVPARLIISATAEFMSGDVEPNLITASPQMPLFQPRHFGRNRRLPKIWRARAKK